MSKRLLVIGHDHVAGLGHLGPAFERRGYALEQVTVVPRERFGAPDVELVLPDLRSFDAVVSLGAPWPRQDIGSWWPVERDRLRQAHEAGTGVLGICFGAQLLSEALGGRIESLGVERRGWAPVEPLAETMPAGPWFQWHADRLVAPPGSVELARSGDGCEGFAHGRSVGVQFHPEMSSEMLSGWLRLPGNDPGSPASRSLLAQTDENERSDLLARVDLLADGLVERWSRP